MASWAQPRVSARYLSFHAFASSCRRGFDGVCAGAGVKAAKSNVKSRHNVIGYPSCVISLMNDDSPYRITQLTLLFPHRCACEIEFIPPGSHGASSFVAV